MECEMNYNFKGVVFDLDGTLMYTLEDILIAMNYALEKNGLTLITLNEVKYFVGSGARVLIIRALKANKTIIDGVLENTKELEDKVYEAYMEKYKVICTDHARPYNGMIRTLNSLKRKGIKLAVLSNKPQRDTESVISQFFGNDVFDVVFGGRDGVPLKPNPIALFETIKLLGLQKEEIVYVGDSDVDVLTFLNADVFGIACCYGFRTKKELIEAGATNFANSPADILRYFDKKISGVVLVDKPYQMTSQDAVNIVKRNLGISKVGHAGTLDPLATGLLIVLVGDATKISQYLLEEEKGYISEVCIGLRTDTWDLEGNITERKDVDKLLINEGIVDDLLESFVGDITLPVPMHSAIKVKGRKLYDIVRDGEEIDVPDRDYYIYKLKRCSDLKYETIDNTLVCKFSIECLVSKGTYIRSLCKVIGDRLNYPSFMTGLRRISSGRMTIDEAVKLEDVSREADCIIDIVDAVKKQSIVEIRPTLIHRIINGREVRLPNTEPMLFMTYENKLVAIYKKVEDGSYHAIRVWRD